MTDPTNDPLYRTPPVSPGGDTVASAPVGEPIAPNGWVRTTPADAPKHRRGRRKERDKVRSTIEWVAVIVGALVVALVVKTFLFQAFYIPSASMEPTLEKGDRVLVNKLSYDLHDIHRGDVIVFELPKDKVGEDGIKDLIKRVVGLPGETIETGDDGLVYIDGEKLDEPYLPEGTLTDSPEIERQVVPQGHVFVLGDNRDNSADSRFANRGPIPIESVVGRAFVQVWPPTDVGGL